MTEMTFEQQSEYTKDQLLECGYGKMFGPGGAHLPIDEMLMMDRITHISESGGKANKGKIVAELDIHPDLWFFKCHFVDDPSCQGALALMLVAAAWVFPRLERKQRARTGLRLWQSRVSGPDPAYQP